MSRHSVRARPEPAEEPARSARSFAFESHWRGLRNGTLVPDRDDFHPREAKTFLGDLALVEVPLDRPELKMRLVGRNVESRLQRKITGHNYLDYLQEPHKQAALQSSRLMIGHPCGLWQLTRIHFANGLKQMMEQTAFPLGAGPNGLPLLLVLANPVDVPETPPLDPGKAMAADRAVRFAFLDIGRGVPAWP